MNCHFCSWGVPVGLFTSFLQNLSLVRFLISSSSSSSDSGFSFSSTQYTREGFVFIALLESLGFLLLILPLWLLQLLKLLMYTSYVRRNGEHQALVGLREGLGYLTLQSLTGGRSDTRTLHCHLGDVANGSGGDPGCSLDSPSPETPLPPFHLFLSFFFSNRITVL